MNTHITKEKRTIITIILLLVTFLTLASQTMMVTALPVIQKVMNVSLNNVQWLTTGYILIIGIVTPLSSNLYDKYSNRQLFLVTTGIFILGTILGSLATSFLTLLIARILQACAGGIVMSFQMTTMVTIYPPEKRGTVLGLSGLVIASGPAIGPTISGIILHFLNWRFLFILVLPLVLLLWLIAFFYFPNYSQKKDVKIDILSVFLSLVGATLSLASLTLYEQNYLLAGLMLIIGIFLLTIFYKRQLLLTQPVLKVQILKVRSFSLLTVIGLLAFMVLIGTEQIIPIFVENVQGLNSMQAGFILLPGAVLNALFAALAGRYYDSHGPKHLLYMGVLLMLIATIPLVSLTETTPTWLITSAYLVRMIGNSLVFAPAMSEAFKDIILTDISHASALNNTFRQVAAAVSTTIMIVIADIPSSFTLGTRLSIWFTVVLLLLMLYIIKVYLKTASQQN
ncbi:DHA2 family efflux MFS transporter permease subunit [Liquorilactobacillus mali]|uniref:DHA2 family efflux MFS transporter permease subunit n=1 Tax=Liquorilactobacillus mali TaxID=1618 RepID=UPI002350F963|nr:DHA2 family efflux MFS transporter permease subunit [Liquorilactobacillus mali]MDC7952568.1 DHA2 family efflux MFS transporter permease subunit [Liquorilactobacillus mali]